MFVPREDYNKLIRIYQDEKEYSLFSFERNSRYLFPFAKLCDVSTLKEESVYNGVDLGLNIDIFPLDAWDSDFKTAQKEVRKINWYMRGLGLTKLNKADSLNYVKRFIKSICMQWCKCFGSEFYIRKILNKIENISSVRYLGCKMWPIYGEREIIPSDIFADTIEVEFEGEKFSAPIGYDTYLRSLYGDYEQDPPLEKQKTHHSFKAYRLDNGVITQYAIDN